MSDQRPKAAPVFMLVTLPADATGAPALVISQAEHAGGSAKRVDQHALLIQLLVKATPAMRAIAAQVFNDPDNPKWNDA